MQIKDIMCDECCFILHTATLREAAQKMKELDCGCIPVGKDEKLCGIVTDRDIAIRATAKGLGPDTKVSEIMTEKVLYCFETDNIQDVAANMSDNQVRRLIVLNNSKDKKLCGIVSVCDIVTADKTKEDTAGTLIRGISECTDGSCATKKTSAA